MSEPPKTDLGAETAEGRPSSGQALAQTLAEAAQRRPKSRNVAAHSRLIPFAAGHRLDAAAAGVFLVTAAGASLGLTGAVRLLVDHLTGPKAGHVTPQNRVISNRKNPMVPVNTAQSHWVG